MNLSKPIPAKINSISLSQGVVANTNSALMSVLVQGICVPIYAEVQDTFLKYIPFTGQHVKVVLNEINGKLYVESYSIRGRITYCRAG